MKDTDDADNLEAAEVIGKTENKGDVDHTEDTHLEIAEDTEVTEELEKRRCETI